MGITQVGNIFVSKVSQNKQIDQSWEYSDLIAYCKWPGAYLSPR